MKGWKRRRYETEPVSKKDGCEANPLGVVDPRLLREDRVSGARSEYQALVLQREALLLHRHQRPVARVREHLGQTKYKLLILILTKTEIIFCLLYYSPPSRALTCLSTSEKQLLSVTVSKPSVDTCKHRSLLTFLI